MGYRIVKQPTAWWPVTWEGVDEDGKPVTHSFELRFRLLKIDALVGLLAQADHAATMESSADLDLPQLYAEVIAQVATDWRSVTQENGDPAPFDVPADYVQLRNLDDKHALVAPNLRAMMNEPGMFLRSWAAFRDCINGEPAIRAGN